MLGTAVIIPTALVPQTGGGNEEKARVIQTLLFVAGLNTLLQTTFETRLPAVIGGSYTFVLPTISTILATRDETLGRHLNFLRCMRRIQGALIVASALQIILGFSGLWRNVASKSHVLERFAVIFSVAIVWLSAYFLTLGGAYNHSPPRTRLHCRTDASGLVSAAPWIKVPYPLQWGAPAFDAGEVFAMMAAALLVLLSLLVSLLQSPGMQVQHPRHLLF